MIINESTLSIYLLISIYICPTRTSKEKSAGNPINIWDLARVCVYGPPDRLSTGHVSGQSVAYYIHDTPIAHPRLASPC